MENFTIPAIKRAMDIQSKNELRWFIPRVFKTLNPTESIKWNWHMELMCWMLSRTLPEKINPTPKDRIRRLIINVPPRSLKSICTSVALPAFIHGHIPDFKIVSASYSGRLSSKMNIDTMRIMRSDWYREMFPHTILDKEREDKMTTTLGGHRIATSHGGTATGEGGGLLIGDDVMNVEESLVQEQREKINNWFDSTFYSRQNDQKKDVIILIMQRLHEDDTTGHLLAKNKELAPEDRWHLVKLPAIFSGQETFHYYGKQKTVEAGEFLHEERIDQRALDAARVNMGSYAMAGQYMQEPAPAGGGLIRLEWFGSYEVPPSTTDRLVTQSWDTAVKAGVGNDYSVCTTWVQVGDFHYLLDVCRVKMDHPGLKAKVKQMWLEWKAHNVLIEDKGAGQALVQDMRREEPSMPVVAIHPHKDKITRLAGVSPMIESGKVWLPKVATWLAPLEQEMMLFPNARHDDQVDSVSQYLNWRRLSNAGQYRIRSL